MSGWAAREPAWANFVRSEVPAIANFSESRHDNRVKRGLFSSRLAKTFSRRQFHALILNTICQKLYD
jgi:hypothetical protein